MNQDQVGPGLDIGLGPPHRLFLAEAGDQRLDPGDDQKVLRLPGGTGGLDLALELLDTQQVLASARDEAGHFRERFVFDHDAGRPSPLVSLNGMGHVHGVAEAGVDVGDDRQRRLHRDGTQHLQMLGHGDQTDVRQAVERREFEARGPEPVKARLLGQARGQGTVRGHDLDKALFCGQIAQVGLVGHWMRSSN